MGKTDSEGSTGNRGEAGRKLMPVIPAGRSDDLHNLEAAGSADLTLFMAGNQFMVMDELLAAFRKLHPDVEKVFYETLPPGLELKQILAGGAAFGDRVIDAVPDVYTAVSADAMAQLVAVGLIEGDFQVYLHNRIVLMVPEGNPAGIETVTDLAGDDVRISQPNPENEDIGHHIVEMYRQAGGSELEIRIMQQKLAAGTTMLTQVHHRETPRWITEGRADVGPVWATEIEYARRSGAAVGMVDPGEELDQRQKTNYYVCRLKTSPQPGNGSLFVDFLFSPAAREIYSSYGFVPA